MRTAILLSLIVAAAAVSASAAPVKVREVPFPYLTIQAAIDAANDGDTIVVHPGTYTGDGNRDIDLGGKAVTVRSEDPDEDGIVAATIIDCQGSAKQPHRAFIFQTNEDANSIVAGFTILNGYIRIDGAGSSDPATPGEDGEDSMGGAISCTGTSPIIRNCIINNCVAEGGAGGAGAPGKPGVPADPGDPNDPNDDIPAIPPTEGGPGGNASNGYGGGIYCDPNSGPTILNCKFNQCSALGGAGGAGGTGGTPGDPNEPNAPGGPSGSSDSEAGGGGICVASGSNATISDCILADCNAVGGGEGSGRGGGIYYGAGYSGALTADMTTCEAGFGGGIYCGPDSNLTISDCSISGGSSDNGAGVYCDVSCLLTINQCSLTDGSAEYGTGIYCTMACTLAVTGAEISNNVASKDGGAIYCEAGATVTLIDCNISQNASTGSGGGIFYGTGGSLTLRSCEVTDNSAGDGVGGGIFAGDAAAEPGATLVAISKSNINDNTALYGAGVCLLGATSAIDDCNIGTNAAEYGGGAFLYYSDVNITGCNINDNTAATRTYCSGGGLYCLDSTARIKDCVMMGNDAQGFGGAVYLIGPNLPGGAAEFTNCLITNNTAGLDGAGLSLNVDATPTISNCTLAGNIVSDPDGSGGGVSCYDTFVEIVNSILWSNSAAYGREIAVGDPLEPNNPPAGVTVTYSDVRSGAPGAYVAPGCVLNWGSNITGNPLFIDGYHLSQTEAGDLANSPCVDTGSDLAEAFDLDRYTTRSDNVPDTAIVDMGYHYSLAAMMCDFDWDGNVDLADLWVLASYWLEQDCQMADDCDGADTDGDTDVDFLDFATCAGVYAPVDETPPQPDPSRWMTPPRTLPELPGAILMRAVTAVDPSGVEYRFVCTQGPGHDSNWQNDPIYLDEGLPKGTYKYKVQARDKSPQQNRTAWSVEASATIN
jgi:predicted outer membrane repeat protein